MILGQIVSKGSKQSVGGLLDSRTQKIQRPWPIKSKKKGAFVLE